MGREPPAITNVGSISTKATNITLWRSLSKPLITSSNVFLATSSSRLKGHFRNTQHLPLDANRYPSWSSLSLARGRKEALGDKEAGRGASEKGVMKGVIMEGEEGHGKGLLLRGVEALYSSLCEIMFPLCNVKECKARLLTSKRAMAAELYVNFCVGMWGTA